MRDPEFEASLYDARLYPQLWRLVLGTLLALGLWAGAMALILAVAVAVVASQQGPFGILPFFSGLSAPDTPGKVLLLLSTFGGLFIGALVAAAALHFRGPGTLFGPWRDWWRGFVLSLAVIVPIYAVLMGLTFAFGETAPNLELSRWLIFLPLGLALLFVQIGAEELFFRGYLQQQLAVRFRSRLIWMWGPSAFFALLHFNPAAGANMPLVFLATFTFGLVAADLTERTGNLGAAMGLHLGNNFFGIFILSAEATITGLALYVTPGEIGEAGVQSLSLAASTLILLGVWVITVWVLDRWFA